MKLGEAPGEEAWQQLLHVPTLGLKSELEGTYVSFNFKTFRGTSPVKEVEEELELDKTEDMDSSLNHGGRMTSWS